MPQMQEEVLLRVFLGEDDEYEGRSLFAVIAERALSEGLSGATVLPGPNGFGCDRRMRTEFNPDAGIRIPVVIEIVDRQEKIDAFLPFLNQVINSGLVTMEKLRARRYGHSTMPGGNNGYST